MKLLNCNLFLRLIFIINVLANVANAQETCYKIPVTATYQSKNLVLNDTVYAIDQSHYIKFETLKFYISHVKLMKSNSQVWIETNSFHLIDFEENDSNALCLNIPEELDFDAIQFNLGIDSLTNIAGVYGGDLDPTKGMYWTWQSGYINFKLQGTSDLCTNPKQEFQLHLGGYINPFNCLQQISLKLSNSAQMRINFNVEQFIKSTNLAEVNHIMSPSEAAILHAQKAAQCFSIKQ
jgi:hypothetical protein